MYRIKRIEKTVSILMTLILVLLFAPVHSVLAAMVETDAVVISQESRDARAQLRSFLDRTEVQSQLTALGINPAEAKARVDSLSDAEVIQIADGIDQLPAGGDAWGTVLFIVIIAFVVLVVMEALGYIDIIQ